MLRRGAWRASDSKKLAAWICLPHQHEYRRGRRANQQAHSRGLYWLSRFPMPMAAVLCVGLFSSSVLYDSATKSTAADAMLARKLLRLAHNGVEETISLSQTEFANELLSAADNLLLRAAARLRDRLGSGRRLDSGKLETEQHATRLACNLRRSDQANAKLRATHVGGRTLRRD